MLIAALSSSNIVLANTNSNYLIDTSYEVSKSVTDNVYDYNNLTSMRLPDIQIDSSLSLNDDNNLASDVNEIPELKLEGENFDLGTSRFARGNFTLPDDVFATDGQLTSSNKTDMYFFSISTDRLLGIKLDSNNSNYNLLLCQVDWDAGVARPTNISASSSETIPQLCGLLPAGDYALRVSSANNTYGSSYTLRYNVANPSGQNVLWTLKPDLSIITCYYGYQTLISNGKNLISENQSWDKHYTFMQSGGYIAMDNSLGPIKIKRANLGTYKTSTVTANRALFLELDVGTTFSACMSSYSSSAGHGISYIDSSGKETPRTLDENDMTSFQLLVIDLDTSKVVDFFSMLNWDIAFGNEKFFDDSIILTYIDI